MPNDVSSVLLDTNILVRFATPSDPQHAEVVNALTKMAAKNISLNICPQIMGKFRQVATRPKTSNGLGWTSAQTAFVMNAFESKFVLVSEPHAVYTIWRRIVEMVDATGRANFDARIVAVAEANQLHAILTYESKAFIRYGGISGISMLNPADV